MDFSPYPGFHPIFLPSHRKHPVPQNSFFLGQESISYLDTFSSSLWSVSAILFPSVSVAYKLCLCSLLWTLPAGTGWWASQRWELRRFHTTEDHSRVPPPSEEVVAASCCYWVLLLAEPQLMSCWFQTLCFSWRSFNPKNLTSLWIEDLLGALSSLSQYRDHSQLWVKRSINLAGISC